MSRPAATTAPRRARSRARTGPKRQGDAELDALPPTFQAEVEAIMIAANVLLTRLQSRRPTNAVAVANVAAALDSPSAKSRAAAVVAALDIAGDALALRILGERIATVGGPALLDGLSERLARLDPPRATGRRTIVRQSWDRIGEFLA